MLGWLAAVDELDRAHVGRIADPVVEVVDTGCQQERCASAAEAQGELLRVAGDAERDAPRVAITVSSERSPF